MTTCNKIYNIFVCKILLLPRRHQINKPTFTLKQKYDSKHRNKFKQICNYLHEKTPIETSHSSKKISRREMSSQLVNETDSTVNQMKFGGAAQIIWHYSLEYNNEVNFTTLLLLAFWINSWTIWRSTEFSIKQIVLLYPHTILFNNFNKFMCGQILPVLTLSYSWLHWNQVWGPSLYISLCGWHCWHLHLMVVLFLCKFLIISLIVAMIEACVILLAKD